METVLKNVLPPSVYAMQYKVGEGDEGGDLIVDACIFIDEKIIPIDSKFSLENYNRLAEERDEAESARLERLFKTDLKARLDGNRIRVSVKEWDFVFLNTGDRRPKCIAVSNTNGTGRTRAPKEIFLQACDEARDFIESLPGLQEESGMRRWAPYSGLHTRACKED